MYEKLKEPALVNTGDITNPTPVSQAILDGYAPDTELYAYAEYPQIEEGELEELRGADYKTVFYKISSKLLGGSIPSEVQKTTAEEAYAPENFDLNEDGNLRLTKLPSGEYAVGLSDGPTGAFKDMAMQPFARWMSWLQQEKGDPLTIMLSTSGDTGPAALEAFSGLSNTEIIAMLPKEGVSLFQWAQMAEANERKGVHVLEFPGDFSYINDQHMAADSVYDLSTVNSVNIARLIAQVPYYVASYLKATELEGREIGDPVDVSVPSGNFGNALSAIIARKMGLPIRNILVATNENDSLHDLFEHGVYKKQLEATQTDSSAQDVKNPSNAWRYFFMLFGNDPAKVSVMFEEFDAGRTVAIDEMGVEDESVREGVISATISRRERASVIRDIYWGSNSRIIIGPHTANGIAAIKKLRARDPDVPMLSMETEKPFKFNEAMMNILGIHPPRPERFQGLEQRQKHKKLVQIADKIDLLNYLREHTKAKPKIN